MEGRVGDWHGGGRRRSRRVASFLTAALVAVSLPLSGAAEGATSGAGSVDLGLGSCGVTEQASVDQLGSLGETTAPAVAVQPDGRILVADQADIYTERMYFVVTRLRPDGVVDLSFGVDGTARRPRDSMRLSVRGILVQPDGRVVVGGIAGTPFNDGARHLRFIRFRPDGTLDPTFGNEGQASIDTDGDLVALSLQPDGAVLGALSEHGQAVVVRVTTSGGLDPTFGLDGRAIAAEGDAGALSIQGDGRILVGSGRATGTTYWTDVQISRLLPSGPLDPSFGGSGTVTMDVAGGSDSVVAVGARDDGRVMTVGTASNRDGVAGIGLTRHLGSGEPDPTFGTGGKMVALGWGAVAAAVEGDGRTVVTTHVGPPGRHEFAIARFAANGELDPAFGDGGVTTTAFGSWEGEPQALARTPGGGWVVSGWVRVAVYGWFVRAVVRYRGDGAAETRGVTTESCGAAIRVTPTLGVDFGRSVPGGITDVRGFRVTSMGTGRLRISGVRLAENRRRVFIVLDDTCSGASLPPGSSCTFRLAFDRSAVGPFSSEQLLVWHNARNGVESVPVRAVGPGPRLAWGWNGVGQLGDGTTADKAVPSSGGPSNVKAMASGAFHDVVLANDGVVWGTGLNHVGQLGDGTTVERHRPVRVATLEPFENVAAGAYHSLALTPGGTVYAWGWNHFGQLGDGTTVNRATPVRVPGLTGVVAIAAGAYHSLALRQDGTVWSWGLNHVGQLGDGTAISRATPVRVAGLTSATSLAGGAFHSLATRADGSAWAWGWNAVGQLGDGTTIDRLRPVRVAGLGDVTMLAAGAYYHSVALTRDGRAWAWGLNHVGQLGDRTTLERHLPVLVAGLTGATSVTGGAFHTLALRDDGSAWAWGWNAYGQLGEGTTLDRHAPVRLAAPTVRSVAAAVIHTQAA